MALIKSGTIGSETPLLAYQLYADQVGASGNSRTVKITAYFKVDGSSSFWYGYACNWRARVHNSYGSWSAIKGTESWNGGQGYRSFSQTLTVDVGTTSSTSIVVGLYTDSQIDNSWDGGATGSFTVGSTNTPPVLSGTVATSPSGIIPENTGAITVTSPVASDSNLAGYRCRVSVNGGGYTEIYRGSSRSYTHNISGYGEGTTFTYCFDCYDSDNAWSGSVYSAQVTKNRFTGDTLNSSSSVGYTDDNGSINFTYSGASNSNGNTSFTRVLSCDGITVYNPTLSDSSATVTVYRTGTTPTTPYIKFDDIKNRFKDNSYIGTLNFVLTTTNAYDTPRTSPKAINVNLQTKPNAVGSCSIATNTNSTAYKTVTATGNKYFLPDGGSHVRIDWTAGSGKLGEAISYDIFVAYDSGSWSKITTITNGALYYNHVIPKQTVSQAFKYKIRTKTAYGTYADRDTSAETLHFYNTPSMTTGAITRSATTCDVQITIKSNSSIPNIDTVGSWKIYDKGATTVVGNSGTLTPTQTVQTLKLTGLIDSGQYDLKVTYKDNTGFSTDKIETIAIGANSPIFFINKYGAGINGVKATTKNALNVKGNIGMSGDWHDEASNTTKTNQTTVIKNYNTESNGLTLAIGGGGGLAIGGGESAHTFMGLEETSKTSEQTYITSDNEIELISNCNVIADRKRSVLDNSGHLHIFGDVYSNYGTGTSTKCWDRADLPTPTFLTKINNTNYWSLSSSATNEAGYLRTPESGLIPNKPNNASGNGGSIIGTSNWRFANMWTAKVNNIVVEEIYHTNNKPSVSEITNIGAVNNDAPRVSNLNTIYVTGWHSWSGSGTGTPTTYGVVLTIIWGTAGDADADRYQLAMGSNHITYCRDFVNKTWSSWRTI